MATSWARKIYVATRALGVYYTDDFREPAIQPTWTAVNTGLSATDCMEFHLDPFDPVNKQYVLTGYSSLDYELYRRDNEGSWASILTEAQVNTLLSTSGCGISSFCTDPSTDGRLWAYVGAMGYSATPIGWWAIYSNDYGDSWAAAAKFYTGRYTYDPMTIRANGNNLWVGAEADLGARPTLFYSYDMGSSWTKQLIGGFGGGDVFLNHNPLYPARVYYADTEDNKLYRLDAGVSTLLDAMLGGDDHGTDAMWFDVDNGEKQRTFYPTKNMDYTDDGWATFTTVSSLTKEVVSVARYSGVGDGMLVGCIDDHVVGAIDGEVATVVGIAGSSPATPPYTNSIPNNCGGVCTAGVQGVRIPGRIYTYDVLFEAEGAAAGVYPFGVGFEKDAVESGIYTQSVEME